MPTTKTITATGKSPAITVVRRINGDGLIVYLAGAHRLALSTAEAARLADFIHDEVLDAVPAVAYRSESPR